MLGMEHVCGVQVLKVMAKKLVRKSLEMLRKLATLEVDPDEEVSRPQNKTYYGRGNVVVP